MKLKSYIFLIFLLLILIFILGVRYGQRIEKNNKVVDYLLKITPSLSLIPSNTPIPIKDASASPTLIKLKK